MIYISLTSKTLTYEYLLPFTLVSAVEANEAIEAASRVRGHAVRYLSAPVRRRVGHYRGTNVSL